MTHDNAARRESTAALSVEQKARILGDAWKPEYEQEAQDNWGDTPEFKESQRRAEAMTESDWKNQKQALDLLNGELVEAMDGGVQPGDARANQLAEAHRKNLSEWFPMSLEQQVLVARSYTDDDRFREYYDSQRSGLAAWLRRVIEENARAGEVDPEQAQWR